MEATEGMTTAYLVMPKSFFIMGQSVAPCHLPATSAQGVAYRFGVLSKFWIENHGNFIKEIAPVSCSIAYFSSLLALAKAMIPSSELAAQS